MRRKLSLKHNQDVSTSYYPIFPKIKKFDYDNEEEHLAAVYYVNDSDGDTIIYNEIKTYQNNKLSTRVRVSPKKGRMVLFNGMHLHTSEYPYTNDMRAIINFNFGPKTMLKG